MTPTSRACEEAGCIPGTWHEALGTGGRKGSPAQLSTAQLSRRFAAPHSLPGRIARRLSRAVGNPVPSPGSAGEGQGGGGLLFCSTVSCLLSRLWAPRRGRVSVGVPFSASFPSRRESSLLSPLPSLGASRAQLTSHLGHFTMPPA